MKVGFIAEPSELNILRNRRPRAHHLSPRTSPGFLRTLRAPPLALSFPSFSGLLQLTLRMSFQLVVGHGLSRSRRMRQSCVKCADAVVSARQVAEIGRALEELLDGRWVACRGE